MSNEIAGSIQDAPNTETSKSWIQRFGTFVDRLDKKADTILQVSEYQEIRISILMAEGLSEYEAISAVNAERKSNAEDFEVRAVSLYAYKERLTTGEGAISVEMFNHSLYAEPKNVLQDAERWRAVHVGGLALDTLIV